MPRFVEAVGRLFKYLEDEYGYSMTYRQDYVEYHRDSIEIILSYDSSKSGEIRLSFRNDINDSNEPDFGFDELLSLKEVDIDVVNLAHQAKNDSDINCVLIVLAEDFRKYGIEIIECDHSIFIELRDNRKKECAVYEANNRLMEIRREAHDAWRNKDYSKVISLYEDIGHEMSHSEEKRLEYAKKKV